jgi:hypothetical protein
MSAVQVFEGDGTDHLGLIPSKEQWLKRVERWSYDQTSLILKLNDVPIDDAEFQAHRTHLQTLYDILLTVFNKPSYGNLRRALAIVRGGRRSLYELLAKYVGVDKACLIASIELLMESEP